jgi:diguanylate cyclase (GGDEF)-like protein
MDVVRIDGEPVSLRLDGQEFECEEETGYTIVPTASLRGFRLSDIPTDISIKPVENIEGHTIHINNDVALSGFCDRSAIATVENMFRRKFWDGETGLSPYAAALRQAIAEHDGANETDFEDDGDYVFIHYEVTITEDLDIQDAIRFVDTSIEQIEKRADQLVSRRKDGLLGIFDRGSFDMDLQHVLAGKQAVALIMADIDHFKQVNDTFGHPVGDGVLRAVAKIVDSKCSGQSRVAYRYGGEELAAVLTGYDAATAIEFAESIRTDVEQLHLDGQPNVKLTLSLGVARATETGRNSAELVRRADTALYRAKQEGRNRVRQSE